MPTLPPEYLKFLQLYDQRKYFEAHEALEVLWRREKNNARDFYRGLIQVAAACVHVRNRNLDGAKQLFQSATLCLQRYFPEFMSIDVGRLLNDLQHSLLAETSYPRLYLKRI